MIGKISNIYTNVVEVKFNNIEEHKFHLDHILTGHNKQSFLQIKRIIDKNTVLAIVIEAKENFKLGEEVVNTQRGLLVPIGDGAKNNVFDIRGVNLTKNPARGELKYIQMNSIIKENKNLVVENRILETGIKVIDFFMPILRGSKLGILGGAGVGKTVLMKEIIFNSSNNQNNISPIFIGSGERSREGLELYEELIQSNLMKNTTMFISQMNEAPGSRMNIVPFGITAAEYLRDYQKENVFLFIDNIYRFIQGANEVSASLGKKPSIGGYQSTLDTDVSFVEDRLYANKEGSITSFQTVFLPMDDLSDPAAVSIFAHLDAALVLSRDKVAKNIYPAVDPLSSNSSSVNPMIIGERHFNAIVEAKAILQKYKELEDVILILGVDELDEESQIIVEKALQLQNFFTQRFFVAETYTKEKGVFVSLNDTVDSVIEILQGKHVGKNPELFTFIGSLTRKR
ncbi:F0F1 ATP synthase subunit beta [Mycoplasmopsis agassizii]|uniref:F0F1 ATP synthase subunit beta n=1 Tax=Mycoplasmopsis agassizii TaxID=33922 RepID=A0A269THS0_9BACT|nr:F0F1 ATP synthase subunit beta [Mycoplasmopsis agassizii]PAK20937.1 F0F1 ATP synthase subunit beta [Mycoplasmopsis agassizii]